MFGLTHDVVLVERHFENAEIVALLFILGGVTDHTQKSFWLYDKLDQEFEKILVVNVFVEWIALFEVACFWS
jgi:hypothetical protein